MGLVGWNGTSIFSEEEIEVFNGGVIRCNCCG